MAKTRAELEQEYQEMLSVSQSMLGSINKMIDDTAKTNGKINEITEEQNKILKSSLSDISEYSDIEDGLVQIQRQKLNLSERYFGANESLYKIKESELDVAIKALRLEQQRGVMIGRVADQSEELANNLTSSLDGMVSGLSSIPLVGGMLDKLTSGPVDGLKSSIGDIGKRFTVDFGNVLKKDGIGPMKALKMAGGSSFGSIGKLLTSTNFLLAGLAVAISLGVKRFTELDSAAHDFRHTTGLLISQTYGVQQNIANISRDMSGLGVDAAKVASTMGAWTNEFEGLEIASVGITKSLLVMNENFGVGINDAIKLNKTFQNMSGEGADAAQSVIMTATAMAKVANVAPGKVIADMADNSEMAYKFFNGSPIALAKAAVHASKLGLSLKEAGDTAAMLLDFESSITQELELGAMLGANINFAKARSLAYDGKAVEAHTAMVDEVSKLGDITKMDYFQKQKLAEATGMEISQLVNQQRIRQKFGKMDEKQLEAVNAIAAAGKDISEITSKDVEMQAKKMKMQHDMHSEMDNLKNATNEISTGFMDMLAPLGSFLMPVLTDIVGVLGDVLIPTFKVLGGVFKVIFGALGMIWDGIMAVIRPVSTLVKLLIEGVAKPFQEAGDAITNIREHTRHWYETTVAGMTWLYDTVMGFFHEIEMAAMNLIPDWIADMMGDDTNINANLNKAVEVTAQMGSMTPEITESKQLEHVGSIDDGIVQNGNIVSTDPMDSIIATKTPEAILGGSVQAQDNSALVSKLDEVIKAINGSKDVYLDKEKVTSSVMKTSEKATGNVFGLGVA